MRGRLIVIFAVVISGFSSTQIASAQYWPAGWILHVTLRRPVTVPAGTKLSRFLESGGQVPSLSYSTLSTVARGVLFVSAGASATQCQVGVHGGAVTSPR
jgi:hypothetical protein